MKYSTSFDTLKSIIQSWAKSERLITKVYLFGSRVKKTHRVNSDIDVAIELEKENGDADIFTTALGETDNLEKSLQKLIPTIKVQLEWYDSSLSNMTPKIRMYLNDCSVMIYG